MSCVWKSRYRRPQMVFVAAAATADAAITRHVEITWRNPARFLSRRSQRYTKRVDPKGFTDVAHSMLCGTQAAVRTARSGARRDTSPLPAADVHGVSKVWPIGRSRRMGLPGVGGERRTPIRQPRRSRGRRRNGQRQTDGTIPNTAGVHGIAFAPALKRGFTSNGRSNTVSVFELDTLRVIQEVPVSGKKPDAILYEPRQNHIITANGESANLSVLDAGDAADRGHRRASRSAGIHGHG